MACGAAIASSATAAMPEIVGECAEFFDPFDPTDIADAVLRLLHDPARRAELGSAGIRRAQGFSWQSSAQRAADIFRRAVSPSSSASL